VLEKFITQVLFGKKNHFSLSVFKNISSWFKILYCIQKQFQMKMSMSSMLHLLVFWMQMETANVNNKKKEEIVIMIHVVVSPFPVKKD
jgi:hypothetical protein